jgi:hypothetical protein
VKQKKILKNLKKINLQMPESLKVRAFQYSQSAEGLTIVRLDTAIKNIIQSGATERRPALTRWFEDAHQIDPGDQLQTWLQTIPTLGCHRAVDSDATYFELVKGGILYQTYDGSLEEGPILRDYELNLRGCFPRAVYRIKSSGEEGEAVTTTQDKIPNLHHLQATLNLLWNATPLK